jgi:hypothetical protein
MSASPDTPQTLEAIKRAAALWILDLGISPEEARRWAATDPGHPAASCLEVIDVMEALTGPFSPTPKTERPAAVFAHRDRP